MRSGLRFSDELSREYCIWISSISNVYQNERLFLFLDITELWFYKKIYIRLTRESILVWIRKAVELARAGSLVLQSKHVLQYLEVWDSVIHVHDIKIENALDNDHVM